MNIVVLRVVTEPEAAAEEECVTSHSAREERTEEIVWLFARVVCIRF